MEENIEILEGFIGRLNQDVYFNETISFEYLKQPLENVLKELETYKKIAEKLADEVHYLSEELQLTNENLTFKYCDLFAEENKCENECSKCIIDWARKEVENEKE